MALSMKDGEGQLDNYIAEFETLLRKAHWERNTQGAVDLFKQGLKLNLHRRILRRKTLPQTLDEWIHAARLKAERMALVKATLGPMGGGNITTHQNHLRGIQNPAKTTGSKRKDPDTMEVDTIRTDAPRTNRLSDEERQ
jgi:hypothetical protein